jgi:propionyl-CoA synthetase
VLDDSDAPFYRWFVGGETNVCYNAVDLHVENGRGDQVAIIHDSPITESQQKITYSELQSKVANFAGVLANLGVEKGDRVILYMPMIPEAVIGMLACARIGAVHCVVFGGFASNELAVRIDDCSPRVIVSQPRVALSQEEWWNTSRCLTRLWRSQNTSLTTASSCSGPNVRPE